MWTHLVTSSVETFLSHHTAFSIVCAMLSIGMWGWVGTHVLGLGQPLYGPAMVCIGLSAHYQFFIFGRALSWSPLHVEIVALVISVLLGLWLCRRPTPLDPDFSTPHAVHSNESPPWLFISGAVLALISNIYLAGILISHIPGVWTSWDAVVSWQRWASDWTGGHWPRYTYGYPQLIPVTWAGLYTWMGTDRAEFAARGFMALFPLLVSWSLGSWALRTRRAYAWFAAAMWPPIVVALFAEVLDSGYVEIPVTFFILMTALALAAVWQRIQSPSSGLMIAAIAAAAAILTKQAGWLTMLFVAMFAIGTIGQRSTTNSWLPRRTILITATVWAILTLPSVLTSWYLMATGQDPSNLSYVTSTIYGGELALDRLLRATTITLAGRIEALVPLSVACTSLLLAVLSASTRQEGRIIWFGAVFPYYLCWAFFFSYDLRNLLPTVPFLCLGMGLGIERAAEFLARLLGSPTTPRSSAQISPQAHRVPRRLAGVALIFASLGTAALLPHDRQQWIEAAHNARVQAGDMHLNTRLIEYFHDHPVTGKLMTTYALAAHTDGIREHIFSTPEHPSPSAALVAALRDGQSLCELLHLTPRGEEVSHVLLPKGYLTTVLSRSIAKGQVTPILATDTHEFMHVTCHPLRSCADCPVDANPPPPPSP